MNQELFEQMYQGQAPWDTGRPQPAIVRLAEAGLVRGSVLDVGCGTGEHVLYFAARGHDCLRHRLRASRHRTGEGQGGQARHQGRIPRRQCSGAGQARQALRHGDRLRLVAYLCRRRASRVRERAGQSSPPGGLLHILCFSDEEPGTEGPRRVAKQEIQDSFRDGWKVLSIEPVRFEAIVPPDRPELNFSPGGPKAWLATMERA